MPEKPTSNYSEPEPRPRLCLRKHAPQDPSPEEDVSKQEPAAKKKPLKLKFTPKQREEKESTRSAAQEQAPHPHTPRQTSASAESAQAKTSHVLSLKPVTPSSQEAPLTSDTKGNKRTEVRPKIRLKAPTSSRQEPTPPENEEPDPSLLPNETHRTLPKAAVSRVGNIFPPIALTPAEPFSDVPRTGTALTDGKPTDKPDPKSPQSAAPTTKSSKNPSKQVPAEPPLFRDETEDPSLEADTSTESEEELSPRIPDDAIRRAIEAELEAAPERRILKLATIAAGLFFSALAVWWSLSGSPFSSPMPGSIAQNTSPNLAAEISELAESESNPGLKIDPGKAEALVDTGGNESTQPDPTPAVTDFINSLEISVLPIDTASRVILVGDISYREGSLLEPKHGLTLSYIDDEARTLYFKDAVGAVYDRSY